MTGSPERVWYSVAEVAQLLGVSRTTVWRWIRAGQLPARRIGPRTLRVERRALAVVAEPTLLSDSLSLGAPPAAPHVSEAAPVYSVTSDDEQRASAAGDWSDDSVDGFGAEDAPPPRSVDAARAARKRAALFKGYDPERVREALREHGGSWSDLDTDAILEELYRAREAGMRAVDER
jgi:excisionase family DNA binding protein